MVMRMRCTLGLLQSIATATATSWKYRVPLHNAADPNTLMPVAGLGTAFHFCFNKSSGNQSFAASRMWLQLGGRRFDGALSYGCDIGVGNAMRASGLPRSEVFFVSKIGPGGIPYPLGYNETLAQAHRILSEFGSYLDLLLVHEPFTYWPGPWTASKNPSSDPACNLRDEHYSPRSCRLSTWRAMVALWQAGKVRSIGVSNYNSSHIHEIEEAGLPLPSVNQIEFSPHHGPTHAPCICGGSASRATSSCGTSPAELGETCKGLLGYMSRRRILANGYSPFQGPAGGGSLMNEPPLAEIATAHNVTSSQVVLHWQWRRHGVVVNPTAHTLEYQKLNLDFFDSFWLSEAEMRLLDEWPQNPNP